MLRSVKELPPFGLNEVSAVVAQEAMSVYNLPFVPMKHDGSLRLADGSPIGIENDGLVEELQEADLTVETMPVLCRHKAVRIWAYFSVVTAAQKNAAHEPDINAAIQPRPPNSILNDFSFLGQNLKKLPSLLADIGWAMRKDFMLWISAVGLLASLMHYERLAFVSVFKRQARIMDIKSKAEINQLFSRQVLVGMIRNDASLILGELVATNDGPES